MLMRKEKSFQNKRQKAKAKGSSPSSPRLKALNADARIRKELVDPNRCYRMSDGDRVVVAFRMAASPFKTHAVVQLICFLLSWPNAIVVGPEVQSLSAPHIVPYARLFLSRWIQVINEDAASVLSTFTQISKQALCFPSSYPDSVLVHGSL